MKHNLKTVKACLEDAEGFQVLKLSELLRQIKGLEKELREKIQEYRQMDLEEYIIRAEELEEVLGE